ncbi:MAG: protein kinase [Deltaproteobacteria bacterium]|nr:protein kinase [Deltaproteobacteria bacterium]
MTDETTATALSLDRALGSRIRESKDPRADALARQVAYQTIRQELFERGEELMFGRYRIDRLIGRGGMAEVFEGYDPELDRRVAIKRVRHVPPAAEGSAWRQALLTDARSAARIQHPHIVEMHDCGLHANELFVVMELVQGPTLAEWLTQADRGWREIVEMFVQAGLGLAAAHARGVVHRDFKPSNVLIGTDGRARVADFGIAHALGGLDSAPDPTARSSGSMKLVGTARYMAPEQIQGSSIGPAVDQFAFCISLYQAVFRSGPFEGATIDALLLDVIEGRPRVPRDRHGAPRALVTAILHGLAARPELRHESMRALIGTLESILRRRQRWLLIGAGALLSTVAGVGGYAWPRDSGPPPCARVDGPWSSARRQMTRDALLDTSVEPTQPIRDTLAGLERRATAWSEARVDACLATRVLGEQSDEVMDLRIACLDRQRASFESVVNELIETQPPGWVAGDLVGRLPSVAACDAHVVRERSTMAQAFRSRTDRSQSPRAESRWRDLRARLDHAYGQGIRSHADVAHREAEAVAQAAHQSGFRYLEASASLIAAAHGIASARTQHDDRGARQRLRDAVPLAINAGAPELVAETLIVIVAVDALEMSHADQEFLLDVAEAHASGTAERATLSDRVELARGTLALRQHEDQEAHSRFEALVERSPYASTGLVAAERLGRLHREAGRMDAARQTWGALRQRLASLDRGHPMLAATVNNLAQLALDERDLVQAERLGRLALTLSDGGPPDSIHHHEASLTLATVLRRGQSYDQALELLAKAVPELRARGYHARTLLARVLEERIEVELEMNAFDAAVRTAQLLAAHLESQDSAERSRTHMMLSKALLAAKRPAEALAHAERALHDPPTTPMLAAEIHFRHAEASYANGDAVAAVRSASRAWALLEGPAAEVARTDIQQWAATYGLTLEER